MKILVLTKRQYMGKDLLDDRFGRFRELPLELARLGHQVEGLTLSYRTRSEDEIADVSAAGDAGVDWRSVNLVRTFRPGLLAYFERARATLSRFQPDLIWACSDALHAIFGHWLAQAGRTKCVIDLYDNFEAFGMTKIPGVRRHFRAAVAQADGVTCFSQRLAEHIVGTYPRRKPTAVVESGFSPELFYPRDRDQCRQQLGLPQHARIIGTAGALHPSRDIDSLVRAYEILAQADDTLHLAFAGPRPKRVRLPSGPRIHDLRQLPHAKVPLLIASLDVAVVGYKSSSQGRFSFPQKLYEMLACQVPVIAAQVGSAQDVLKDLPQCLFEPENPASLAAAAAFQLTHRQIAHVPVPTWAEMGRRLEDFFKVLFKPNTAAAVQRALS